MIRFFLAVLVLGLATRPARAAIDHAQAESIFDQAHAICSRDAGALWGHTLCGPMLQVDPDDQDAVANQADAEGFLRQAGNLFVGTLPKSVIISDTTERHGRRDPAAAVA